METHTQSPFPNAMSINLTGFHNIQIIVHYLLFIVSLGVEFLMSRSRGRDEWVRVEGMDEKKRKRGGMNGRRLYDNKVNKTNNR